MKKSLLISTVFAFAFSGVITHANVGKWFKKNKDIIVPVALGAATAGAGAYSGYRAYKHKKQSKVKPPSYYSPEQYDYLSQ